MADWYKATTAGGNEPKNTAAESADDDDDDDDDEEELSFHSRRSCIFGQSGCVSTSQSLATSIGIDLCKQGYNAADIAICIAAILSVIEPCSTGIGGDMFCLYYEEENNNVVIDDDDNNNNNKNEKEDGTTVRIGNSGRMTCINGSGRSPKRINLDDLKKKPTSSSSSMMFDVSDGQGNIDTAKFRDSAMAITVPGAVQGWEDLYNSYGSGSYSDNNSNTGTEKQPHPKQKVADNMLELLQPAIDLATNGFPVSTITSYHWKSGFEQQIKKWYTNHTNNDQKDQEGPTSTTKIDYPLTVDGINPPEPGDIMKNHDLAIVLHNIGTKGAHDGFYTGKTAQAIIDIIKKHGGCMELDDLDDHSVRYKSEFVKPVCASYHHHRNGSSGGTGGSGDEYKLWSAPPNGQGIAGLIALTAIDCLEEEQIISPLYSNSYDNKECHGSDSKESKETRKEKKLNTTVDAYHTMIEMMRLGFADVRKHVTDPDNMKKDIQNLLLDRERIKTRAMKMFNPQKATIHDGDYPDFSSCTVSFQVVDIFGNSVSFVNSNFMGFGTGIVPDGCGFTLQNRGAGFHLHHDNENHINIIGPAKRPYHTIIPGMITIKKRNSPNSSDSSSTNNQDNNHIDTDNHTFYATISNMGGNMQPQGHLQLFMNMIARNMDPQSAIDSGRFCITDGQYNGLIYMEDGIHKDVIQKLIYDKQHNDRIKKETIKGHDRAIFGRAQIIMKHPKTGVLWAGSDGRADGCALAF